MGCMTKNNYNPGQHRGQPTNAGSWVTYENGLPEASLDDDTSWANGVPVVIHVPASVIAPVVAAPAPVIALPAPVIVAPAPRKGMGEPAIRAMAERMLDEHGLSEKGWTFRFDNAKKRLGQCQFGPKLITMSRRMADAVDEEEVRQTMLHEVAHALLPSRDIWGHVTGHGPLWKSKARSIGYTGERTARNPHTDGDDSTIAQEAADFALRPHVDIRANSRVAMDGDIHGTVVNVLKVNYRVLGDDGVMYKARIGYVSLLDNQEMPAGVTPPVVRAIPVAPAPLTRSFVPVIVSSRVRMMSGREGVVEKILRTNMHVRSDDGQLWRARINSVTAL